MSKRGTKIEEFLRELRRILQGSAKASVQTVYGYDTVDSRAVNGEVDVKPNGTVTIIIQVNGGARDSVMVI